MPHDLNTDAKLPSLADWVANSRETIVFTGAGISTESGVPDFRSPSGVWQKTTPVYYDEFLRSPVARHRYWTQKSEAHGNFVDARPNPGHKVIAKWERENRVSTVITQNIDGLHQIAGNENVLELHGTAREVGCIDCEYRTMADNMVAQFLRDDKVPCCPRCGAALKHATVSFGQMLPVDVLEAASTACARCDLILAIGSSLVVTPAADLPRLAKTNGARLAIMNREETPLDAIADVVLRGSIGELLVAIDAMIGTP